LKAYQEVAKQFDNQSIYTLMDNSWNMVEGALVVREEPEKFNKRGLK
jgi:protein-tyrosine phosphatase